MPGFFDIFDLRTWKVCHMTHAYYTNNEVSSDIYGARYRIMPFLVPKCCVIFWPWSSIFLPWRLDDYFVSRGQLNNSIKFENPMWPSLIEFWRLQADHVRRITWPVKMGSVTAAYLESPTLICPLSVQHLWGYDDRRAWFCFYAPNFALIGQWIAEI